MSGACVDGNLCILCRHNTHTQWAVSARIGWIKGPTVVLGVALLGEFLTGLSGLHVGPSPNVPNRS